jgi:hypothetical protein
LSAPNSNSHLAVKKRIEQGLGGSPTLCVMQPLVLGMPCLSVLVPPERQPEAPFPDQAGNFPDMPI